MRRKINSLAMFGCIAAFIIVVTTQITWVAQAGLTLLSISLLTFIFTWGNDAVDSQRNPAVSESPRREERETRVR